jgi:hypothetical protein
MKNWKLLKENMDADKYVVARAMSMYGGGFVKKLGELILLADPANLEKIKNAFPEYWEKYSNMSGDM